MTIRIRNATPADRRALQRIRTQCVQESGWHSAATLPSPDFFARTRAYEDPRVFVAEVDGSIVGSAACGLRTGLVTGRSGRIGYEFRYCVAPAYRRRGLGRALHHHIEGVLREQGAALSCLLVAKDNLPAVRLFESLEFTRNRTLRVPFLLPYKTMIAPGMGAVRPARPADLPAIASLLNATWNGFALFTPFTANSLAEHLARLPDFTVDNLLVLERNGGLSACVGYWNRHGIIAITGLARNPRLRFLRRILNLAHRLLPLPSLPAPGDALTQWCLTPVGFTSPEALHAVLVTLNNRAVRERIGQLFLAGERHAPWLSALKGFLSANAFVHLYVKPLEEGISLPPETPVYLDAVDL